MRDFMKRLALPVLFLCAASSAYAQLYSVSTNMIGMATGNLNVEVSATAGRKWSVHLPVMYNPFTYDFISENTKMQNLTTQPGVRYWFTESYMRGFVGVHGTLSRYHAGWKALSKYRYDGMAAGGGISFGYAKMIGKSWNLEFEAAADVLYTRYEKYECRTCGFFTEKERKAIVAPTKLAVSMVYLF